jgi:hypothetical protein
MTKYNLKLIYEFMDNAPQILSKTDNTEIQNFINEMIALIQYQIQEINHQRMIITGYKHQDSWKHYDRQIEEYNIETRSYVDKPAKSGNMSC